MKTSIDIQIFKSLLYCYVLSTNNAIISHVSDCIQIQYYLLRDLGGGITGELFAGVVG